MMRTLRLLAGDCVLTQIRGAMEAKRRRMIIRTAARAFFVKSTASAAQNLARKRTNERCVAAMGRWEDVAADVATSRKSNPTGLRTSVVSLLKTPLGCEAT